MLNGLKSDAVARLETSPEKQEALQFLVRMTCEANGIGYFDEILDAVIEREHSLSTGIGLEIAVPHCRHGKLKTIINGALLVPSGIEFNAVDGKPVKLLFFIASPAEDIQGHLACLSDISHAVSDEEVRRKIVSSATADELYEQLTKQIP